MAINLQQEWSVDSDFVEKTWHSDCGVSLFCYSPDSGARSAFFASARPSNHTVLAMKGDDFVTELCSDSRSLSKCFLVGKMAGVDAKMDFNTSMSVVGETIVDLTEV